MDRAGIAVDHSHVEQASSGIGRRPDGGDVLPRFPEIGERSLFEIPCDEVGARVTCARRQLRKVLSASIERLLRGEEDAAVELNRGRMKRARDVFRPFLVRDRVQLPEVFKPPFAGVVSQEKGASSGMVRRGTEVDFAIAHYANGVKRAIEVR